MQTPFFAKLSVQRSDEWLFEQVEYWIIDGTNVTANADGFCYPSSLTPPTRTGGANMLRILINMGPNDILSLGAVQVEMIID